jgi:hypothetical protein
MTKTGIVFWVIALAFAATLLVAGCQSRRRWHEENLVLQQQIDRLAQPGEQTRLVNATNPAPASAALTEEQFLELLRLRGEIGVLRQQTGEVAKLRVENQRLHSAQPEPSAPGDYTLKSSWAYTGYADPESAFQSTLWASASGDPMAVLTSLHPTDRAAMARKPDEEIAAKLGQTKLKGYRILGRKKVSDDEVVLTVHCYPDHPEVANGQVDFRRVGTEWRWYRGYERTGLSW